MFNFQSVNMSPVTGMKLKLTELDFKPTKKYMIPNKYSKHHFAKVQTKQSKRTRYSLGSMETMGLSPNLTAKFLRGTSITQQMILKEIERHQHLKIEIKQLKRKLKKLKTHKGEFYPFRKDQLKTLLRKKKTDYDQSRVAKPKTYLT